MEGTKGLFEVDSGSASIVANVKMRFRSMLEMVFFTFGGGGSGNRVVTRAVSRGSALPKPPVFCFDVSGEGGENVGKNVTTLGSESCGFIGDFGNTAAGAEVQKNQRWL